MSAPPAEALTALLAAYADRAPDQADRVLHVPPAIAAAALELLPADFVSTRLNLVAPPMTWLVELAAELPRGRLVGSLTAGRGLVVFDGIQADAVAARQLAERVAAAYPADGDLPAALGSATAETWTSWTAEWPSWSGSGTDLLTGPLPPGNNVVGLWWD